MSKRIAVLVSGGGTNLQALLDAQGRGELVNGTISAVISSSPEAYALKRAERPGPCAAAGGLSRCGRHDPGPGGPAALAED